MKEAEIAQWHSKVPDSTPSATEEIYHASDNLGAAWHFRSTCPMRIIAGFFPMHHHVAGHKTGEGVLSGDGGSNSVTVLMQNNY